MEQKSDVAYRAEKLYKNSREKFGYVLREVISNAIHATIIRDTLEKDPLFQPKVKINIELEETKVTIEVNDNGEGFTDQNRKYFTHLDTQNPQKDNLHFHPMGQGRLALVYFSDKTTFQSVYKTEDGTLCKKAFEYPEISQTLFDIESPGEILASHCDSGTFLTLYVYTQKSFSRANTFFKKYFSIDKLKIWLLEVFFPYFIEYEKLNLLVSFNGQIAEVNRSMIENSVKSVLFTTKFDVESNSLSEFKIWLIEKENTPKTRNQIICYARHLRADIGEMKIEYEIDLPIAYDWFLTSEYFDNHVDPKGDRIEISLDYKEKIQFSLSNALNKYFEVEIEKNRQVSMENINSAKDKFLSLSPFIDERNALATNKVLKESDLICHAVESKGKIEKGYWTNPVAETEEIEKLLNSSLHIYMEHRKRILQKFKDLIKQFDDNGEKKKEVEATIHDLFLKRGSDFRISSDINHLHNLWIIDDKYTIFSKTFGGISTRNGQEASDIYIWSDDPNNTKELLILELKSTSKAHNAGSKYESMIAQIKRYAAQVYKDPVRVLNWDVNPDNILYFGVILAKKKDIIKEVLSNNIGGTPHKIPFLDSSYFFNEQFAISDKTAATPYFKEIKIEIYSYEDIYKLSSSRNNIFLRLLKGEFNIKK